MAVKSPGAILRSSFRPERVFFDQVSGVWSPAADFRIECRSPPRRERRENGGGRFFDRMAGLGDRGRPRPLKQPPGGLSWRRSAAGSAAASPRGRRALRNRLRMPSISSSVPHRTPWAQAAAPQLSPVAGNSTGAASTPSPAKHRPAPRPGPGRPAEAPIERVGWSPSSARRRGRRHGRADSAATAPGTGAGHRTALRGRSGRRDAAEGCRSAWWPACTPVQRSRPPLQSPLRPGHPRRRRSAPPAG